MIKKLEEKSEETFNCVIMNIIFIITQLNISKKIIKIIIIIKIIFNVCKY